MDGRMVCYRGCDVTPTVLVRIPAFMRKYCLHCKSEYTTNRQKSVYCGPRCRTLAYRERHGIVTKQTKRYSVCQRPNCEKEIPDERPSDAMYCSNSCKQKVYNDKNKDRVKQEYAERTKLQQEKAAIKKAEKESERIADELMKEL